MNIEGARNNVGRASKAKLGTEQQKIYIVPLPWILCEAHIPIRKSHIHKK